MLEKGLDYTKVITGKADTLAKLTMQINALTLLRNTCEPTDEEVAEYKGKVDEAAAMLTATWREDRIFELLEKPRSEMWVDYITHPETNRISVRWAKKDSRYESVTNDKGKRISYDELNKAYIVAEIARMEQSGEMYDIAELTIARDRKFNSYLPHFFSDCYKRFIDHNLGKEATGAISYEFRNRKGASVDNSNIPSVNKLVEYWNELMGYLLPEGFTINGKPLHMLKKDVRHLGLSINDNAGMQHKESKHERETAWFFDIVKDRINDTKTISATVTSDGMNSVKNA